MVGMVMIICFKIYLGFVSKILRKELFLLVDHCDFQNILGEEQLGKYNFLFNKITWTEIRKQLKRSQIV